MVDSIQDLILTPQSTILDAMRRLEASHRQIVLVVDDTGRLVGTVTDGDVRRGILREVGLHDAVSRVMNAQPLTARQGEPRETMLALMRSRGIYQLPVVDEHGRLTKVERVDDLIGPPVLDNWVVLMAGGQGMRLRPLTETVPKPLLTIGAKPLLETIIENCVEAGFRRFFLSVNYLADKVREHFGDGSRWNIRIEYLEETEFLGTAGSLTLLPERPTHPLLVMNGDILTRLNLRHLLDFHAQTSAGATLCVRDYALQVPYGVVNVEGERVTGFEEKPVRRFLVNAGIYVLSPGTVELVPPDQRYDMPTLLDAVRDRGQQVSAFPVREYWIDIGQHGDFEKARREFANVFS